MSGNNNDVLIIGGAVLVYMYLKNQRQVVPPRGYVQPGKGGQVQSMPGNVGSGWKQVGVGAVAGFLQSVIGGVRNNTSQTVFPSNVDPVDYYRGDILQEGNYDTGNLIGDGEGYSLWA